MLSFLLPDMWVDAVENIDLFQLQSQGIVSLIVDVDNTLTPHHQQTVSEAKSKWIAQAKSMGFSITLLSNNHPKRIAVVSLSIDCHGIGFAAKPFSRHYRRIVKSKHLNQSSVAVIGDQLFTDIAGGKIRGYFSIYVEPISKRDIMYSRFSRVLERWVIAQFRKKGWLL